MVIDVGLRKVVQRFDFGRGVRPHCAVMNPPAELLARHSARNALNGSTFAALRAGIRLATIATNPTPHTAIT